MVSVWRRSGKQWRAISMAVAGSWSPNTLRQRAGTNGIGRPEGRLDKSNPGLGTTIIEALAKQLDASVEILMDTHGTTVSITHATIASQLPAAA